MSLSTRVRQCAAPLALTALVLAGACSDMTGPSETPEDVVLANGAQLGQLVAGETSRILPSVTKNAERDELEAALGELSESLATGLASGARVALAELQVALDRFEASIGNQDTAADLAAIKHAVNIVREAMPTVSNANAR